MDDFVEEPLRSLLLEDVVLPHDFRLRLALHVVHELFEQSEVDLAEPADGLEE